MHLYTNQISLLSIFLIFSSAQVIYSVDINQSNIPFVINESGDYNLVENIQYKGQHNAITIKASNVSLDFNTFSLKVSHHDATGIAAEKVSDISISNGSIQHQHHDKKDAQRDKDKDDDKHKHKKGSAIHLHDVNAVTIDNLVTVDGHNGLVIKKSHDIDVDNSAFYHAGHAGIVVHDSKVVDIHECVFADNHYGMIFKGSNRDAVIMDSAFPSSKNTNLLVERINGMLIENSSFTNNGGSKHKPNIVQFGGANAFQMANDVIMKNVTVINRPVHCPRLGNTAPEGIGIYQGSGFLLDSVVIDIDNTNQDPTLDLSGIHISNPGLGTNGTVATNVIIRNSIVQGPATNGIYPDTGSSGIVIENNLVSGALKNGIFLAGTTASTVMNNTVVNNGTNGIFLGESSSSNNILNNSVSNNGFNPIASSISPLGNGIGISSDSSMNILEGNTVSNNAVNGIDDQGTNNQIFSNTAFGNANENFVAATDTIVISETGASTLTTANISVTI